MCVHACEKLFNLHFGVYFDFNCGNAKPENMLKHDEFDFKWSLNSLLTLWADIKREKMDEKKKSETRKLFA